MCCAIGEGGKRPSGELSERAMADYGQFRPQGQHWGLCGKDGMTYEEVMAESEGEVEKLPARAYTQVTGECSIYLQPA